MVSGPRPLNSPLFLTGPIDNLSNNAGFSHFPAIATLENNVYVVWQDQDPITEDNEILYRKSTDGGMSFGTTVNLTNEEGNQGSPDIAASFNLI